MTEGWKMIRVRDSTHEEINRIGSCGMSKDAVIGYLINFYDKNHKNKRELLVRNV